MVPPLDETIIGFGERRIAKNTRVENRIDSVQAARDHIRPAATVVSDPAVAEAASRKPRAMVTASMTKAFFPITAVSSLSPVSPMWVGVRLSKTHSEADRLILQKCILCNAIKKAIEEYQAPAIQRGRLIDLPCSSDHG
jgi:hypothetical protein